MKRKTLLISLGIIFVLFISTACNLLQWLPWKSTISEPTQVQTEPGLTAESTALPTAIPTSVKPSKAPAESPALSPTESPSPTATPSPDPEPEKNINSTKMQDGIWFSYDSALWDASGDAFFPYLQFKSESDCQVYLNYGHGMSEFFEWTEAAKTIAGFNFVVTEWRYTGTRDIILKAYRLGDDFLFTVENPQATALSERCLNEAEELLKLSAQQGFNPYTQQAPATASVLPPIVYSKEGNIYAYFLDSENILSITKDGGKYMGDIYVRYANPRVSLDGRFVAYERFDSQSVYIYSFETGQRWSMDIDLPNDYSSDHIMGWDRNNRLYISRVIGVCNSMVDPPQGPYQSNVLRFDMNQEKLSYLTSLKAVGTDSTSYSRGYDVSPSGRFLSFWLAGCNMGDVLKAGVYDTETEDLFTFGAEGRKSISNAEDQMVYFSADKFRQDQNVYPVVWDIYDEGATGLDIFDERGTVWGNPYWSYDDRYLILSQNAIPDLSVRDYSEFYWWGLVNTDLVLVDLSGSVATSVNLTGNYPGAKDWAFGAWSPVDYRMVIINRPGRSDFSDSFDDELWLYDFTTDRLTLIDQGVDIESADW